MTLHFSRPATVPFHIELRSLSDSLLASRDCEAATGCDAANPVFSGIADSVFVVSVKEAASVTVDTVAATFQFDPSSRECAPRCYRGDADVRLAQARSVSAEHAATAHR